MNPVLCELKRSIDSHESGAGESLRGIELIHRRELDVQRGIIESSPGEDSIFVVASSTHIQALNVWLQIRDLVGDVVFEVELTGMCGCTADVGAILGGAARVHLYVNVCCPADVPAWINGVDGGGAPLISELNSAHECITRLRLVSESGIISKRIAVPDIDCSIGDVLAGRDIDHEHLQFEGNTWATLRDIVAQQYVIDVIRTFGLLWRKRDAGFGSRDRLSRLRQRRPAEGTGRQNTSGPSNQ